MDRAIRSVTVVRVTDAGAVSRADVVASEEPLEIQIGYERGGWRVHKSVSITMRTPGHDFEHAAGFLFAEGILQRADQIERLRFEPAEDAESNVVRVELKAGVKIDWQRLDRHFYTTSSCGVCGKTSLAALRMGGVGSRPRFEGASPEVPAAVIQGLPESLRAAQAVFEKTGGLHGAGLFEPNGRLIALREDVGRHNAVDKLIGSQWLTARTPLLEAILCVSGRASFELMQKAVVAGIPMLVAVGAPSSLAIALAEEFGATLIGFTRADRFNIYSSPERIAPARPVSC